MQIHVRVQQHIDSTSISYKTHIHSAMSRPIESPADFANALGYELSRVTKSVVCRSRSNSRLAVLVTPMGTRINFAAASHALGLGRLEIVKSDALGTAIDYPKHGVSPFGLDPDVSVLVDTQLLGYESILVGGGRVGVEIELLPADLVRATHAQVASITA